MLEPERILLRHIISEKATMAQSLANQYTFKVHPDATKIMVSQAVEKAFKVNVAAVNILNTKPKAKRNRMRRGAVGRKPGMKKAIVRLKEGESLELV